MTKLIQIHAPHYTAGLEVVDGRVSRKWCAPILSWAKGRLWPSVESYFRSKGYTIVEIAPRQQELGL